MNCCGNNVYKGVVVLILGVLFLLGTLGVIEFSFATYWPLFLILLGIGHLFFPPKK